MMSCRLSEQSTPGTGLGTVVLQLVRSRDVTLCLVPGGTLWKTLGEHLPHLSSLHGMSLAAGRAVGSFEGGKS